MENSARIIEYRHKLQTLGGVSPRGAEDRLEHFNFGLEAEYDQGEPLFPYYWPPEALRNVWGEEKHWQQAIKERIRSAVHGSREVLLEKRPSADGNLPDFLFRDDTGNLELHGKIEIRFNKWCQQVDYLHQKLGPASWQAMVSLPRELFFEAGSESVGGFLNFIHEADVISRLDRGPEISNREPARTFCHPYLGPMTDLRHRLQRKFLRENALGRMLDPEDLIRPARRDQSFKFVGSTAYRPDVAGPERMSLEVRDCHRDVSMLKERVARIVFHWKRRLKGFDAFAQIPPFAAAESFRKFSQPLQNRLIEVFPVKAPEVVKDFPRALEAYEVYRNFAYPLRDWRPWIECISLEGTRILQAQENYLQELDRVLESPSAEDSGKVQWALVRFVRESGLAKGFLSKEGELSS